MGSKVKNKEIEEHYKTQDECNRLKNGHGRLEFERTKQILSRYLSPSKPSIIYDIGGGAGDYAFWLAQQGHQVHLIDLVPKHISQAKEHEMASGIKLASVTVGDACNVDIESSSADMILLLGPLYHLINESDRRLALKKAYHSLKPGGKVVVAAISRFASMIDGFKKGYFQNNEYEEMVETALASGVHRSLVPGKHFTTAYFHKPEELKEEIKSQGFSCNDVYSVEGPAWILASFEELWQRKEQRDCLLSFLEKTESEPSLLGCSAHLLAVGTK